MTSNNVVLFPGVSDIKLDLYTKKLNEDVHDHISIITSNIASHLIEVISEISPINKDERAMLALGIAIESIRACLNTYNDLPHSLIDDNIENFTSNSIMVSYKNNPVYMKIGEEE